LPRGTWNHFRAGIVEPLSPALAGRFFAEPPGKPGDDLVMYLKYASRVQESSQG